MSSIEAYHKHLNNSYVGWFERYQQDSEKSNTVSLKSVQPYISFKLAYDFAFAAENAIDIHDPIAINYFMGDFCYKQVLRDFQRSAIVMQTETERLYFGSPSITQKRMRRMSKDSVYDFETFIGSLEEGVFHCALSNFDERQRETLGMILRIINQGVSAFAMKMLNGYLQVRSGDIDMISFDGGNEMDYLMRPDVSDEKGPTQIDILCGADGKIQLSRREYLKVQKLDAKSLVEPDDDKAERWCLLILLSKDGPEESSDWRLHFSVSKIKKNGETMDLCSSSGSLTKSRLSGLGWNNRQPDHSDVSPSNSICGNRSSISFRSLFNSFGKPGNLKPTGELKRKRRRRPIRDFIRNRAHTKPTLLDSRVEWFKQNEDYTTLTSLKLFEKVHPYINFKLAHDLSSSHDNSIEIKDWLAINYILGDFSYWGVRHGFCQSAIVVQTETEKLYFGCAAPSNENNSGAESESSVGDFETFITFLEKWLFKKSIWTIDDYNKQTLGLIMRFIGQDGSEVAMKILKMFLRTRSGSSDTEERILLHERITRINIECKENNIHLSKEENLTVQKSLEETKLQALEESRESWKMVTNIDQKGSMSSSNYNLHFSVEPHTRHDAITPSHSSQNSFSFNQPCTNSNDSSCAYWSSLKTDMYVDSPRRSCSDCMLIDTDDSKNDDLIHLPRRKLGMLSDTVDDYIAYVAATAPSRAIDEDDESTRFPLGEFKKDNVHGISEEWIVKDYTGV